VTALVLVQGLIGQCLALQCHSCYVKPPPRAPGSPSPAHLNLCSQFDGSERFVVNCSQSTFCQTRTYRFQHYQGPQLSQVVITERGCAQQAYQHQALIRGKWRMVTTILEEVYSSGCLTDREWAGPLSTDTEYCYCDQDRCNNQTQDSSQLDSLSLLQTNLTSLQEEVSSQQYSHHTAGGSRPAASTAVHLTLLCALLYPYI